MLFLDMSRYSRSGREGREQGSPTTHTTTRGVTRGRQGWEGFSQREVERLLRSLATGLSVLPLVHSVDLQIGPCYEEK